MPASTSTCRICRTLCLFVGFRCPPSGGPPTRDPRFEEFGLVAKYLFKQQMMRKIDVKACIMTNMVTMTMTKVMAIAMMTMMMGCTCKSPKSTRVLHEIARVQSTKEAVAVAYRKEGDTRGRRDTSPQHPSLRLKAVQSESNASGGEFKNASGAD